MTFQHWRRVHLTANALIGLVALAHCGLTPVFYGTWSPNTMWFLGTGLGLLLLAVTNWAHVGGEPCQQPTAPVVRWANFVFLALGLAAPLAVPEPQTLVLVAALAGQAIAGYAALSGLVEVEVRSRAECESPFSYLSGASPSGRSHLKGELRD